MLLQFKLITLMQLANLKPYSGLTSSLSNIPDGSAGIRATLEVMRSLANQFKTNLDIRTLAVGLTSQFAQKDYVSEVKALQVFVRDKIRYVKDVKGVETLQTPLVTLKMRSGDCDDKCTLLASLLESIGHPARFVAVGFQNDVYEHVLVETRVGRGWLPLECTEPVEIGWYPSNVKSRMVIYV